MKTITKMMEFKTFEERLDYLRLDSASSQMTFDELRELNQRFYKSTQWKRVRNRVIARDRGCDLGVPGMDISGRVLVHHINPLKPKDIYYGTEFALNPEFLVTVSEATHNAIHYNSPLPMPITMERQPGDTTLWR